MNIKIEISYGNISWKGLIGCFLIGIIGRIVFWLMRWDWVKLFSLLFFCRKYIMWVFMVFFWLLFYCL